jgi:hypothetical protein
MSREASEHSPENTEPTANEILQHLMEEGHLEGPARGIARQVLARGEKSLSQRQQWVFATQVGEKYLHPICRVCENPIPPSEVVASWSNGCLCGICALILGPQS